MRNRQDALDEAAAVFTVTAEGVLAPQHARAQQSAYGPAAYGTGGDACGGLADGGIDELDTFWPSRISNSRKHASSPLQQLPASCAARLVHADGLANTARELERKNGYPQTRAQAKEIDKPWFVWNNRGIDRSASENISFDYTDNRPTQIAIVVSVARIKT